MSPNAIKVLSVLHELNLPFDEKIVDITRGESHTPEFRKLNPNAMIPVLDDDGFRLSESNAICVYLAEKQGSSLMPKDLKLRAEVNQWLSWHLAQWGPATLAVQFERLAPSFIPGYQADQTTIDKGLEKLARFAPVLDQHLTGRTWVVGDQMTVADLALASGLFHATRAQLPIEGYVNLQAWFKRIQGLDCWQKASPKMPASA